MRIISGNLKGKKISLPNDKKTRPLRDLVKESIFNLIEHSNKFKLELNNGGNWKGGTVCLYYCLNDGA